MNYWDKLKSRKFQLALGAIFTTLGAALAGEMTWEKAIAAIVVTIISYLTAEGAVDYARAKNGTA